MRLKRKYGVTRHRKSYNLRGFSFREFLNLQTGMQFQSYTLDDIIANHKK